RAIFGKPFGDAGRVQVRLRRQDHMLNLRRLTAKRCGHERDDYKEHRSQVLHRILLDSTSYSSTDRPIAGMPDPTNTLNDEWWQYPSDLGHRGPLGCPAFP